MLTCHVTETVLMWEIRDFQTVSLAICSFNNATTFIPFFPHLYLLFYFIGKLEFLISVLTELIAQLYC